MSPVNNPGSLHSKPSTNPLYQNCEVGGRGGVGARVAGWGQRHQSPTSIDTGKDSVPEIPFRRSAMHDGRAE